MILLQVIIIKVLEIEFIIKCLFVFLVLVDDHGLDNEVAAILGKKPVQDARSKNSSPRNDPVVSPHVVVEDGLLDLTFSLRDQWRELATPVSTRSTELGECFAVFNKDSPKTVGSPSISSKKALGRDEACTLSYIDGELVNHLTDERIADVLGDLYDKIAALVASGEMSAFNKKRLRIALAYLDAPTGRSEDFAMDCLHRTRSLLEDILYDVSWGQIYVPSGDKSNDKSAPRSGLGSGLRGRAWTRGLSRGYGRAGKLRKYDKDDNPEDDRPDGEEVIKYCQELPGDSHDGQYLLSWTPDKKNKDVDHTLFISGSCNFETFKTILFFSKQQGIDIVNPKKNASVQDTWIAHLKHLNLVMDNLGDVKTSSISFKNEAKNIEIDVSSEKSVVRDTSASSSVEGVLGQDTMESSDSDSLCKAASMKRSKWLPLIESNTGKKSGK